MAVFGGFDGAVGVAGAANLLLYDLASDAWRARVRVAPGPPDRFGCAGCALHAAACGTSAGGASEADDESGGLLVFGGVNQECDHADLVVLRPPALIPAAAASPPPPPP